MTGSSERARLFVALELPAGVRELLLHWRWEALRGGSAPEADPEPERRALRLIAGEQMHVTLCFIGSQEVSEIPLIGDACAASATETTARLAVGEAIWLPPRRPRVLAVRLADLDGSMARIQASLSERLQRGGWYEPERRPFLPHVTVARVSGSVAGGAPGALPAPPADRFLARELTLYRSHLARAGARYEPLRRFLLGSA